MVHYGNVEYFIPVSIHGNFSPPKITMIFQYSGDALSTETIYRVATWKIPKLTELECDS